jgi:hypothetical protein
MVTPQDGADDKDKRPLFYFTGYGVQFFIHKLEEAFHCRQVFIGQLR